MPMRKLRQYLDKHHVNYATITHSPAYTAQQIAASAHVPGKHLAKTVIITIDDRPAMVVLPANCRVDLPWLRHHTGTENINLASEQDFASWFPDCETGAMPPFGNLFGMDVYLDSRLTDNDDIVFNAGNHTELLKMSYKDYSELVQPIIMKSAMH